MIKSVMCELWWWWKLLFVRCSGGSCHAWGVVVIKPVMCEVRWVRWWWMLSCLRHGGYESCHVWGVVAMKAVIYECGIDESCYVWGAAVMKAVMWDMRYEQKLSCVRCGYESCHVWGEVIMLSTVRYGSDESYLVWVVVLMKAVICEAWWLWKLPCVRCCDDKSCHVEAGGDVSCHVEVWWWWKI
jgi:hypothetical protein